MTFTPGTPVIYTNWNGAECAGKVVADPAPDMPGENWVDFDWGGTLLNAEATPVMRKQLRLDDSR